MGGLDGLTGILKGGRDGELVWMGEVVDLRVCVVCVRRAGLGFAWKVM